MYRDDEHWNAVLGEELNGFLDQVGTIDGRHQVSPTTTQVQWRSLPFYDQVVLIRLRDEGWDPQHLQVFFLANQGSTDPSGRNIPADSYGQCRGSD